MKMIYKVLSLGALLLPGMVMAQKPANLIVKPTTATLTIDGKADEAAWATVTATPINKPYKGETVDANTHASFKMLYDKDNIYVFVDVVDNVVYFDATGDWKGDAVEIYFGLPGYTPGQGAGDDKGRQFFGKASQDWVDDTTKLTHQNWYTPEFWPGVASRSTDGVKFGYQETVAGYAFEFQINKSALENMDFSAIGKLDFDFTLADNDVAVDGGGVRNRLVYYNSGDLQFANENWGALDLATLEFQPAQTKPADLVVKPTTATFTLDGVADEAAWASATSTPIAKPYAGETVDATTSASFKMLYDADNIYVFVTVIDNVVTVDNAADWKGDKVELYFGLPGYTPGQAANAPHGRQLFGVASQDWADGTTPAHWVYNDGTWPGSASRATDGVAIGFKETVAGYNYEFKINKSALENVDFSTLGKLDFDLTLADNDVVGDNLGVRNRLVYYNSGDLQFANENWGALDLATLEFKPAQTKPADLIVSKTKAALTIDGVADEAAWAAVPATPIAKPYAGETVDATTSATFKMLYDSDNLYVFVNVIDNVVTVDNAADWKGDKVELYFGLPGYTPGQAANAPHGRQLFGVASQDWADGTTPAHWVYNDGTWPGSASRATDGVTIGYKETVVGYAYEFKINKSALENVDFSALGKLDFDLTLADNDVVGDNLGVRNRLVYYNSGDLQFANENWGALDLATLEFKAPVVDPSFLIVKKAGSALTIDGKADEATWAAVAPVAINKPYTGETVDATTSANFKMLYDTDNIYVFVDVTDNIVTVDNIADWKGDKVEIYFGLPGYTPGQAANAPHGRQLFGVASQDWADGTTPAHWVYNDGSWPGSASRATDGVTFAYNETVAGYAFEFKINKSALENVDFAALDSLDFDFTLADNDIVGDGLGVRNRLVYYNTGNLAFANENWGALDLASLAFSPDFAVAVPTLNKVSNQSAYVANGILKFKGYDNTVDLDIYSLLGQKMLSAKKVSELNVSSLNSGIYLVRVNNGKQVYKVIK
jgi:hypothetical protein